jgi:hypothetical protein
MLFVEGMRTDRILCLKSAAKYVNKELGTNLSRNDISEVYQVVLSNAQAYYEAEDTSKVTLSTVAEEDLAEVATISKIKVKGRVMQWVEICCRRALKDACSVLITGMDTDKHFR